MAEPTDLLGAGPAPAVAVRAAPRRTLRSELRRKGYLYLFLAPTFLFLLGFMYYPSLSALGYSFFNWDGFDPPTFVGLQNFIDVVNDPEAQGSVPHLIVLTVLSVIITLTAPLFAAELIFALKHKGLQYWFRVVFVIPMVVPFVVIILVWQFIYDPNYGLLNALLTMVGLKGLTNTWLGNPDLALYCIAGVGFPWISGFNLLVYLAGLQNIPQEVLDASLIDGAGRWRRFLSVHLPLILGQVKLLLILSIINTLQGFVTVYILTQGGPANATTVPGLEMYVQAFQYSKFGFGMALGTLIFLVILALTYLNMRYIRPSLEYQA